MKTKGQPLKKAAREPFTWHLREPFNDIFDRTPWWDEQDWKTLDLGHNAGDERIASLYELARRHPYIGKIRLTFKDRKWHASEQTGKGLTKGNEQAFRDLADEPSAVQCLCRIGLLTRKNLSESLREYWHDSIQKLKGLDARRDLVSVLSDNALAEELIFRASAASRSMSSPLSDDDLIDKLALDIPHWSRERIEQKLADSTIAAYRAGRVIISIDGDVSEKEASLLVERVFKERKMDRDLFVRKKAERCRFTDWLPLIKCFDETILVGKPNAQLVARYKRAMNQLDFWGDRRAGDLLAVMQSALS